MIVNKLIRIQQEKNLTDDQFAKSLGIHRISWVRNKRTGLISSDTLLRAFQVYPGLKENFLSQIVKDKDKRVTANITSPYQTHQDKRCAIFRAWVKGLVLWLKRLFCQTKAKTDTKS